VNSINYESHYVTSLPPISKARIMYIDISETAIYMLIRNCCKHEQYHVKIGDRQGLENLLLCR